MSDVIPSDPLFRYQWFLNNNGQSGGGIGSDIGVLPVWVDYKGKGIRVAVVDDGVQLNHPDLAAHVDVDASWDAVTNTKGGSPVLESENHGTAVAGLIGAIANNGIGGSGVAPEAVLLAYRIDLQGISSEDDPPLDADADNLIAFKKAFEHKADIVSNSWGTDLAFVKNEQDPDLALFLSAIDDLATLGREGKGSIIVFANGNSGRSLSDGNLDNVLNSRQVIAVAALNDNDVLSSYSTRGANLLISAPAGGDTPQVAIQPGKGVLTTDRTGTDGYNNNAGVDGNYAYNFNGTSAATPIASGVIALLLEANPNLGYRDVQEILAHSARFVDSAASSWTSSLSGTWNGGGSLFSRDYGFGAVNAHAAVRLAEVHSLVNEAPRGEDNVVIRSAATTAVTTGDKNLKTLELNLDNIDINHVDLHLNAHIKNPSQIGIYLVSPSGTNIPLVLRPENTIGIKKDGTPAIEVLPWPEQGMKMGTKAYWGEESGGTWKVVIAGLDESAGDKVDGVDLTVYGDDHSTQKEFIYTDDFAKIIEVGEWRPTTISRIELAVKAGETAIINTAAVSSDVKIDLGAGQADITGHTITIASGTTVTKILAGDGNDTLIGDDADNVFFAGRGGNIIDGGAGVDTLLYNGSRAGYNALFDNTGQFVVNASFLSDVAVDVEKVTFQEGTIHVKAATDTGIGLGALYEGLLLRGLDGDGFRYWADEGAKGVELSAIADTFLASDEYAQGAGQLNNAAFIDSIYENLLSRDADEEGALYWVDRLDNGGVSRADVVISFGHSDEYQNTQLTGLFTQIADLGNLWA